MQQVCSVHTETMTQLESTYSLQLKRARQAAANAVEALAAKHAVEVQRLEDAAEQRESRLKVCQRQWLPQG